MGISFGAAEKHILELFSPGSSFVFNGINYRVVLAGKPTCSKGEPKTDTYVLAKSIAGLGEFKISFKKKNADFLENKINNVRAAQLFGDNWREVIIRATLALQNRFASRPLIYKQPYKRTGAGAITLGWKFELLNVNSGDLSGNMFLTRDQVIDVYAGTNLSWDKRDAYVDGNIIKNSGIANFILFEENQPATVQDAANMLISIEDYVRYYPNIYFACKALNYRTYEGKYDGNRPLAVYVDWDVQNGKLVSRLVFDTPLQQGGDYAFGKLDRAMKSLGITSTSELGVHNVADVHTIWNG